MTNKKIQLLAVMIVCACAVMGCPKSPTVPQEGTEAVVLKYQFPRGRVLKYRSKSDTRMRFSFPFITEPQTVRSETTVDYTEEVIQEPLGGYATVEQRITAYRLILYQGGELIYDSAQPEKFAPQNQFQVLFDLKDAVFRYEISQNGSIRRSEGFDDMMGYVAPSEISAVFEKAQPVFPQTPLKPGDTWQNKIEIPLTSAKGFKGSMTINDRAKLVEIKKDAGSRKALIELNRTLNAAINMWDPKSKKFRPLGKGGGSAFFTILLDIEKGIIILSDGKINITVSSKVSDQPRMDEISISWDGIVNTKLLE